MNKFAAALLFIAISVTLLHLARAPLALAAPRGQSTSVATIPTPTDEPPRSPYVFPTPVFIPTYPGDTPVATTAPRSTGQPTGPDTYTVQSGDSPWTIAQKVYGNGSKYPVIMSANGLTDTTRLRVGAVLKIPPLAGTLPAAATTPPASALTPALPTPAPSIAGPSGVSLTPAATPTRTATSASIIPGSIGDALSLALNILAGILVLGAVIAGILAFLVFIRNRRMQELNSPKRRLQIR
ncbi:MAG TPA: LysM peptidoglycan-binding domain-containing protein [Anaerolineae bacterium]